MLAPCERRLRFRSGLAGSRLSVGGSQSTLRRVPPNSRLAARGWVNTPTTGESPMLSTTVRKTALTAAALGAFGLGGAAIAGAASNSSSSSGTKSSQARPQRDELSGDTAAKVKAAALDKVPGATVLRTEAGGPYSTPSHTHIKTSDGKLHDGLGWSSFNATAVPAGHGRRGPAAGGPTGAGRGP